MKLISTLFTKKATLVALFMVLVTFTNAGTVSSAAYFRVFWNKFEVVATNDNKVVLTWNVTEYNNKTFSVQHSVDGIKWEEIALIQSQKSAESITNYSYTHNNKLSGKQFYRLLDVDVDHGSSGFSPVKTLVIENEKQVTAIWPNPAVDHIVISNKDNSDMNTKARIYDLTGKVMAEVKLGPNNNKIAINELPTGTYIVKIENTKGASYSQKIVKQ